MRLILSTNRQALDRLLATDPASDAGIQRDAVRIVNDVKRRGDRAVLAWRERLGDARGPLELSARDLRRGWTATPRDVRAAIRLAVRNIRRVAEAQRPQPFVVSPAPGVRIEQRVRPFGRVGCYVPGGRYPLPSTLLMTVIPAQVAGVGEVIVACPRPAPVVLCAALEADAHRVFRVGGAQAIAAMAFGTASIPRVDKIVGPGNAWVAAAKALVARECGVDLHAGPSEIGIYSNRGRADWIAADLVAQAEHDPAARAIFVTTNRPLALSVRTHVKDALRRHPAAAAAIRGRSAIILATDRRDALAIFNRIAPEHAVCDTAADARDLTTAGTVFVGAWSAQAAGDYTTGSNHVLPTGGAARLRGGLSTSDCVRVFTVQTLTKRGLRAIGPAAATLADAEGLSGHAASIRRRLAS